MLEATGDSVDWQQRLEGLATERGLPGCALGILRVGSAADGSDDRFIEAAHGVVNVDTGVPVTTDTVFQIGSISKVWTTTLVMQLVDEGLLSLDEPVASVITNLRLSDAAAQQVITLRHLCGHSSGLDGDLFVDTGRGEDALEKFVAMLHSQAQLFPPGETYSYCNAGFGLAGRVIELVTGQDWDTALHERVIAPMGLRNTSTLPEDAILRTAAVGHVMRGDGVVAATERWMFPRCAGPAGLVNTTAADLLAFARLHMADGVHTDGARLLSADATQQMQTPQVRLPDGLASNGARGLGWSMDDWSGHAKIGHNGAVIGQYAYLDVVPSLGVAVAFLTNGPGADDVWRRLEEDVFRELGGIAVTPVIEPPAAPVVFDPEPFVGAYARRDHSFVVTMDDEGLRLRGRDDWGPAGAPDPYDVRLIAVGDSLFTTQLPGSAAWSPILFGRLSDGVRYLYVNERLNPEHKLPLDGSADSLSTR